MAHSRAVLITGVSSLTSQSAGTGRAIALRLHSSGWPVYATGRSLEGLRDLADQGMTTLQLDVTDEKSMAAAVKRVTEDHGAVGVLINNAASNRDGLIGVTPMEEVRSQFATNVFGMSRMTQLVLPGMREQRGGRIVMMSSIFGLFATAGKGYYQATKFAMEAISDALRAEVARDGIKVVVIEPSGIRGWRPVTVAELGLPPEAGNDEYADFWERFVEWYKTFREVEHPRGLRGRTAARLEDVVRVVEKAISTPKPRTRYRVGVSVRALPALRRLIGDNRFQRFVRGYFPSP